MATSAFHPQLTLAELRFAATVSRLAAFGRGSGPNRLLPIVSIATVGGLNFHGFRGF